MDERSLWALLAKAERDFSGPRRGSTRLWAAAALILTVVSAWLGTLLFMAESLGPLPRMLAMVVSAVFGLLALYCWLQALRK